jgi:phosphoglycerate dehydrogenase-like enzyme
MALKVVNAGRPLADPAMFEAAGFELVQQQVGARTPKQEYIDLLREADGAMIGVLPLTDAEVLEACPRLKVVSRAGVGVDSIDLETATRLGVLACNTPGVNTTEVADHAMALLLSLTRRVREFDAEVKAGRWSTHTQEVRALGAGLRRLAGSTVGIVGLGAIGRAFATRIRGFGPFRVVATDPYVPQTEADLYGVELVSLDELLTVSDFITVHTPATEETRHIFSSEAFERMKPSAVLINCARGPLVDAEALHIALTSGQIAAAALDVTEQEPIDAEDPLLGLDNLIITPHIAGGSPVTAVEGSRRQAENVLQVLSGRRPHHIANPEVIKTIAVMRASDPGRWDGVPDFSTALQL